ncbi:NTF2-like protein [Calocera viscosa TUFC12733]|uniref:NTF2-like protein n=1 Tax=Calocera viscosa (strain TUFC12733) TaxID=1330018 RepID=A0A167MBA5_CALVF|nr:NTF2-like protein [Calocera viscosa TUFC12733]
MTATVELQEPLTHRKDGPGLVIVVPSTLKTQIPQVGFFLDPLPARKWAEEGFCVATISLAPDAAGELEPALNDAIGRLFALSIVSNRNQFGLIVYDTLLLNEAMSVISAFPKIGAVVGYSRSAVDKMDSAGWLSLIHLAGAPLVGPDTMGVYTYNTNSEYFVIPGQLAYDKPAATLAHQRTLVFLRKFFDGPYFDLEKIWEEHTLYEFGERAVEKTMATMVQEPYVNHVPTLTGGIGRSALTEFYAHHFIFSNPDSITLKLVSRTVGPDRVVDEMIIEFDHDRVIDWMLPGIPPTGKHVSIPLVGVVNVRGDKLYHEHIYWDQASVLAQIGLLPPQLAFPADFGGHLAGRTFALPVAGSKQAEKMMDPVGIPSNDLIP